MTDGDEPTPGDSEGVDAESIAARLDEAAETLEAAETEADLDDVDATLDEIEANIEAADLPEPDDEDEDAIEDQLEEQLDDVRSGVEEQRGPYAEDVADAITSVGGDITSTDWTEAGATDLLATVDAFVDDVNDTIGTAVTVNGTVPSPGDEPFIEGDRMSSFEEALEAVASEVEDADLDADDDADVIATLLDRVDAFEADVEDCETWSDLEVRDQLDAYGFYDVLDHYKDFPPELSALKNWEERGRADMIVLGLEKFGSAFMEEHALDALKRLGDEAALDAVQPLAKRRNVDAIEVLGKVGSDEPLEMLLGFIDGDKQPPLQRVVLRAIGEIGSEDATEAVAQKLASEEVSLRSHGARTLGLIGDPRAVDPLTDVLENDESWEVRGSAAWALVQIGTKDALEAVAAYDGDDNHLVGEEAARAKAAL